MSTIAYMAQHVSLAHLLHLSCKAAQQLEITHQSPPCPNTPHIEAVLWMTPHIQRLCFGWVTYNGETDTNSKAHRFGDPKPTW
jgi:hypothetical protein